MLPNDPTVQVAFIGIVTTLITTTGVVVVALLNNKRERGGAADKGVESTLRERIMLRDEQLADCKADLEALRLRLDSALEENEEKTMLIVHLRGELAQAKGEA